MASRTIVYENSMRIEIVANDHLSLNGWESPEIHIDIANERNLIVNQRQDVVYIEAEDDCIVSVPLDAAVTIANVGGSASIVGLNGHLSIDNIGGHLTLNQVNSVTCENVGGHLRFSQVRGDITVANVGGNIKGEGMQGKLSARNVGGSVRVNNLNSLDNVRVGGNVRARLLSLGADVRIVAGGAIRLWLPQGVGYEMEATSGGEKIVVMTNGERSRYSTGHQRMTVAGGGPLVQLAAGGSITVVDARFDDDALGDDWGFGNIEVEVNGFDDLSEQINARIRSKMEGAEKRFRDAERRAHAASARAEESMQRAMEQLNVNFSVPTPGRYTPSEGRPPAAQPSTPAKSSDEERLMILNMLKEGKISAVEASRLLDVLDGKFH